MCTSPVAIPCQPHYPATLSGLPRLADSSQLEQSFSSIAPQRGPRIRRRRCNAHRALQSSIAHVRAAWQEQIAAARQRPGLLPEIMRRRDELLPRFAAYYTHLRALPRRVRRALQRQWRLPLAGVALMLALGQSPALAATIPVGGSCTLVDAITAANTDTATGGCPAGNGPTRSCCRRAAHRP